MEKKVLLVFIGFSIGSVLTIMVFNFQLFEFEKTLGVVEIANLFIVAVLSLAIPILISPQTESTRKSKEILVDEINQFLSMIEILRDWLSELPNEAISENNQKSVLFNFKKIRQHLVMLEKEVERFHKKEKNLREVNAKYQDFWITGTEEMYMGKEITPEYKLANLESATNFEMSLKELRYEVRN